MSDGNRSGVNWMRGKRAADDIGQRLGGERLGQTRHRFEEDVTAGQERDEQSLEQPALTDDDPTHLEEDPLDLLGRADVVHRRHVVSGHWSTRVIASPCRDIAAESGGIAAAVTLVAGRSCRADRDHHP